MKYQNYWNNICSGYKLFHYDPPLQNTISNKGRPWWNMEILLNVLLTNDVLHENQSLIKCQRKVGTACRATNRYLSYDMTFLRILYHWNNKTLKATTRPLTDNQYLEQIYCTIYLATKVIKILHPLIIISPKIASRSQITPTDQCLFWQSTFWRKYTLKRNYSIGIKPLKSK